MKEIKEIIAVLLLVSTIFVISGCSISDSSRDKVSDIDFTVVDEQNLPKEIKDVIEEKKADEFKVIFSAEENMYIAIGYGMKETSGYSIAVNDLYLTEDSICIDTNLIGPKKGETISGEATYPYIVVMIENMDYPVVFE